MTKPLPQRRKRAPIDIVLGSSETLAVLIAALTVAFVAALPEATLWNILVKGGLAQDLSILAPPAPPTAHLALAMLVGGIAGLFALVAHRLVAWIQRRRSSANEAGMPARRRADSHPDAPPRPPLMASRDLPPPPPTATTDASDRTDDLSGCVTASPISQNGTTGDTSLHDLLFRFERGLFRRIAVCEAQIASAHLTERMIFAPGAPTMHSIQPYGASEREPQPTPRMPTPANDLADAVEVQLESALLTLRRLAEQGRR
ncbi:hypothetical protein [Sphingobium sp. CR28]|uniref:hypothetical protein n=1 Tax=Sphingobium sp. CR28 TaxID=3400272 RepID=UPI003FEDDEAB